MERTLWVVVYNAYVCACLVRCPLFRVFLSFVRAALPSPLIWGEEMRVTGLSCMLQRRPAQRHEVSFSCISLFLPPAGLHFSPLFCHTLSLIRPFLCVAPFLMTQHFCAKFPKIKEKVFWLYLVNSRKLSGI